MANARELVLKGLYQIEEKGAYSNHALRCVLEDAELRPEDKSFAAELLMGVVRNKLKLDYIIMQFSKVKLKKLSPWVHEILWMGVYQIVCMEHIPDSAACNEAVKLAGRYAHGAARGFVNGVLRSISREKANILYPKESIEQMSVVYSCPQWLTQKLAEQYGVEGCERILADSHKQHAPTIRMNPLRSDSGELVEILRAEGISLHPNPEDPECFYVDGALNVYGSPAYKNGLYTVQNTSSMAAVKVLNPQPGETVLDVCAAPGGKTTQIAEQMKDQGKILAWDIHPHKIALIQAAAERLGLSCIRAEQHDAAVPVPDLEGKADRVLADVPCSGIGVIHKKPDIKWKRKEEDIPALCRIQREILKTVCGYVKAGGTLVYSTCTILAEENQEQAQWFQRTYPDFELVSQQQLLTCETGGSGFYIAEFLRKR